MTAGGGRKQPAIKSITRTAEILKIDCTVDARTMLKLH